MRKSTLAAACGLAMVAVTGADAQAPGGTSSASQAAGLRVEGDAAALQHLIDALDPMPQVFAIVAPKRQSRAKGMRV